MTSNASMIPLLLAITTFALASGHGYMEKPPARNSCWRFGFAACVINYDDNGLRCGGDAIEDYKCGVCGDKYGQPNPSFVVPGAFATGTITRTYIQGQTITVEIKITANHLGWFEFRLGEVQTPPVTWAKLPYLLQSPSGTTRFPLGDQVSQTSHQLVLPVGLSCDKCVLQWYWKAGNSWGTNATGHRGIGLGKQETFVNCADVKIVPTGSTEAPSTISQTPTDSTTAIGTSEKSTTTQAPTTQSSTTTSSGGACHAVGAYVDAPGMDNWCVTNCQAGYCPESHCSCDKTSA